MANSFSIAAILLLIIFTTTSCLEYSYSNQTAWNYLPGSQCSGRRQSPVNIVTNDLGSDNSRLTGLQMNSGWSSSVSGKWLNNGHTLKFTPSSSQSATTTTFIADYRLIQFHFHWGPNGDTGSENTVNGNTYSGELHFVHQNTTVVSASSQYAVVAVFLRSNSSQALSGIWQTLVATIPGFNRSIDLTGIVYNQMLPDNMDYYYFEGSLTTPLCNEVVEWFVLQTPVDAPAGFFERLRQMNDTQGEPLTLNYRDVQPLNDRTILQYSASSVVGVTLSLLVLLSVFSMLIY